MSRFKKAHKHKTLIDTTNIRTALRMQTSKPMHAIHKIGEIVNASLELLCRNKLENTIQRSHNVIRTTLKNQIKEKIKSENHPKAN